MQNQPEILIPGGISLAESIKTIIEIADRFEKQLLLAETAARIEREREVYREKETENDRC